MTDNRIPVSFNDKSRQRIDRLTRRVVSVCGVGILLVMLVLFFWLLWVVTPLFISPTLYNQSQGQLWHDDTAVAGGIDASNRWAWRIDRNGSGRFLPLNATPPAAATALSAPIIQAASDSQDGSTVLVDRQGDVSLVMPDFSHQPPGWRYPLGKTPLLRGVNNVQAISLVTLNSQQWQLALAQPEGIRILHPGQGSDARPVFITTAGVRQLAQSPDGQLIYSLSADQLNIWQREGDQFRLRDSHRLSATPQSMALLSGGRSLLLMDRTGVSQWFDITGDREVHLQRIRLFTGSHGGDRLIVEPQRRVFATLSDQGSLAIFASKQDGPVLRRQLSPGITAAWFAPQGDGLWVERHDNWQYYRLNNPWPDISWRNFWQKIWYENYPKPDYVWQSTSAEDHYQGKYSLVPLIAGTLKAALLALAAAMYTAWFMSPGLRRYVKPGIEMMGALPTVVIGLIASYWPIA